jgi:hypothetical protein
MKNLQQSPWDHTMLYSDRYLKDGQILIRLFFSGKKGETQMWKAGEHWNS